MKQDVARRGPVNGWAVAAGILCALLVTLLAMFVGFGLALGQAYRPVGQQNLALVPTVVAAPSLVLGAIWYVLRRRTPDFSAGILIGACFPVLAFGGCRALILGG